MPKGLKVLIRAHDADVISPKPVSGQCDKRMLVGALCPVQLGYDMGYRSNPEYRDSLR